MKIIIKYRYLKRIPVYIISVQRPCKGNYGYYSIYGTTAMNRKEMKSKIDNLISILLDDANAILKLYKVTDDYMKKLLKFSIETKIDKEDITIIEDNTLGINNY